MIVYDFDQRSDYWYRARLGIPTASAMDRIITPDGKKSKGWEKYQEDLLSDIFTGDPMRLVKTEAMERGTEMEAQAVQAFEFLTGKDSIPIGFATTDDGSVGASCDRLVGEDETAEIKCPQANTHIHYMLWGDKVDPQYKAQIQTQLLVTGRKANSWVSYHDLMPTVIVPTERDDRFIAAIQDHLYLFNKELNDKKKLLIEMGAKVRLRPVPTKRDEPPIPLDTDPLKLRYAG